MRVGGTTNYIYKLGAKILPYLRMGHLHYFQMRFTQKKLEKYLFSVAALAGGLSDFA